MGAGRGPHPQPGRPADRQEHSRPRPPGHPDLRGHPERQGRRGPPARAPAQGERREVPGVHRPRALGHRQHQDLRRVPRPGHADGRRDARVGRPRAGEQARGHPPRGARPPARRRRGELLGRVPRPLRQPDEPPGPRREAGRGAGRASGDELRPQARPGGGRGAEHQPPRGFHARVLQLVGQLLLQHQPGRGELALERRAAAAGHVHKPQEFRVQQRPPRRWHGAEPGGVQVRAEEVDVTFQNLDSSEISLTDVSHYFDSDPTKLVAGLREDGKTPSAFIADTTTAHGQVRSPAETVRLDSRTKLLNPKWYEGMMNSGFEGVREIQNRLQNTMGRSAASGQVDNWVYEDANTTFMEDEEMQKRLMEPTPTPSGRWWPPASKPTAAATGTPPRRTWSAYGRSTLRSRTRLRAWSSCTGVNP